VEGVGQGRDALARGEEVHRQHTGVGLAAEQRELPPSHARNSVNSSFAAACAG
jgi:hypothetical protein